MAEADRILLTEVRRYTVNPGDVIVLKVDGAISDDATNTITDYLKRLFPDNKAMILDSSVALEILAETDAPNDG
jgi:hypothetical protein